MAEFRLAALQCVSNSAKQHIVAKWFGQEFDSPGLHRPHGHWYVAVACDEDDRHLASLYGDAILQIQTVEARKTDVEHQTAWSEDSRVGEEFPCRRECFRFPAFTPNHS